MGIRRGTDFVFTNYRLGDSQTSIAQLLDARILSLESMISGHDEDCVEQVYRVICHYYLPPCGNVTHPLPPSSLCQEECEYVEEDCRATWIEAKLAFTDLLFMDCSDTSQLLSPLPHCCTGADISGWFREYCTSSSINVIIMLDLQLVQLGRVLEVLEVKQWLE